MKKTHLLCLVYLGVLFLAGCAAGPNTAAHIAASNGNIAGFWLGLWHGIIAPITFIISLFSNNVNVYEIHNNGGWYNFGFLLSIGGLSTGGSRVASM
jgi:hypothetical protein